MWSDAQALEELLGGPPADGFTLVEVRGLCGLACGERLPRRSQGINIQDFRSRAQELTYESKEREDTEVWIANHFPELKSATGLHNLRKLMVHKKLFPPADGPIRRSKYPEGGGKHRLPVPYTIDLHN